MSSDNVHPGISLDGPYPERSNTILNTLIDSIANKEFGSTDSVNDAFESTRLVLSILETRFTLSNKQVTFLSNEFLALLHRPSLFHIPLQTQILHCLSIIWRRYRYCPTLGPVDWRFFLTLLQKIHIQLDYKRSAFGHNVVRGHRESLIKAIARGKRFFAPDSAPKIIEALWSRGGSPHNLSYHINFVLLHLFLPPDNYRTWVPMLMEKIQRIDPCSKVLACVLSVLSRSAKKDYNQRTFNFEQYLPQCFNWFLQHLPLSVDGATGVGDSRSSQKVWPKELDWILRSNALSRYTAKFIVYNIRKDSQQGISLLQRFFQATSTFFHPSNAGAWTSPLADFLSFVSRYFAKLYWKLPSDERTEIALNFFDAIFPIASSAIYSRSSTMVLCAQDCIKNLGYILPDKLFSALVAEAKLNLETTSESNRTLASLSLLSAVCHPLFDRRIHPNGAQYLNTILWSALESFDGINLIKSISALSLFGMVFYMVPLLDGKEQMTDNDNEEEARHATVGFPEWALAFTEKLCNILKHFDAVEKTSHRDQGLARILYRTCRPFFCSLSRSSHHACLKFLTSFLLDNTQLKSRKYFGIITRVASLGYPERAFNDLTLPLLHQITSSGNDAGKIRKNLEELASEHVEWLLYLAATSIRESGGNHLVQYADQIASVFFAAVSSESKSVRKVGRKLMRYTLAALTTTYPVEFRPSSPTSWESSTWRHWQFWGEFAESFKSDPSQHKIVSWHRPSQSELLAGQKLTLAVISASQSVLLQNLPTSSIEEIINNLMNVRCVLEGCLTIAGDFSGEPISGHRSQNLFEPLRLLEPHYLKIGNASLRDWCTSVVLRVSSYFRETDNKSPSVKPELWTVLVSICNKLLNVTAISDDALEQTATSNRYAIRSQREFESGKRCIMRALLVEQSHIRYLRCFQLCRLFLSYTVDVRELINFVRWCCLLDFQSVRSLSTATLAQACDSRHFTRNEVVMSLTDIIRAHDVSDKVVLGAIECLHNRHFLSWITSSLDLVSSTIVSICDSSHHQDDLVQTALIEFFSAFADRLHLLPIHSADQIQAYNSLCTQLLHLSGNEEGKSSHWRSQLMAARFLLFALRNDINVSVQHINFFWKHCFSDFVPLRRICISALSEVFTSFNSNSGELVMFSEIVTDSPSPAMLCELDSKVFYDTNDSGWSPDSKCAAFKATDFTKTTPLFPDWVISIQKSLGSDQMTKFVTALEEDHSKASQNAGSSKGRLGAGDVIAASVHELMQSRLCWPKTTFLSVHDALMFEHVLLVQGLCLHCPDLIESFVNVANHLMSRNQSSHSFREAQVTAAEIFAGIGGSSKYWSTHLQNRYFVSLSQLLANAIEKCPSDSVKDWSSAVRFVCTDMDPKRVHWLVSIVFNEAFGDNSVLSSSAPSQTFKRLLFLQAIMVEVAWRSPSLYDSVATKISANPNLLYSPFSQIRQEVSRLLCFVLRNSYRPGFEGNAISSIETILAAFEQILSPLIIQDWQTDNSTSISALETVIYWVVFCCTIGESTFSSDVIVRLISIVIHACHHPNAETAALAKHCLLSVAWTNFDNCYLQRLMDGCNNIIQSEALSFHSHLSAITFFSTLAIRHLFLLDVPKVKLALAAYEKLLGSSRIECREGSSRLLTGFISCAQSLISLKRFSKRFMQEAKSPTNAVSKHGAILALTALIKSEPYRVPEWMPEILAFCASFINDPAPIGGTIQKLFIEFKRTHQDTWHVDKEKFTEDQLTAVNEAIIAPSYFA